MTDAHGPAADPGPAPEAGDLSLLELLLPLAERWKLLLALAVAGTLAGLGASQVLPPVYTARTTFLPPPQPQNGVAAALANLGALSGLAGAAANVRTPADQYVALLSSTTVTDRIIDAFSLRTVYDAELRVDARRELADRVRIAVGKKDGLITIEVEDGDPKRAAEIANRHVEELRLLTGRLALTEAQLRRSFLESQLGQVRERLAEAQAALERSGFDAGALRAEPKSAAASYAKVRAELTAAEVWLRTLRASLTDSAPEVQQQAALVAALRAQVDAVEARAPARQGEYVGRFREYKYQETLFEALSRQYELARVEEAQEGPNVQVVDVASPPERRSWPRRGVMAAAGGLGAFALASLLLISLAMVRRDMRRPAAAARWAALGDALRPARRRARAG